MSLMNPTVVVLAAMLAMAPLGANAHMLMASPVPFGAPNNSPLDPSGSDFPCKAVPYTVTKMNQWPVGSTQELSFIGTAVHGGGSCQISVTTDKAPTKDSKWKVIHSIEGGCPAAVEGNLTEDGPDSKDTFPFTIPSELPNGELTMAWTWFNRIGNREMYMNCAPVTVTGGADDTAAFDALPDMAIANIGIGECKTTEQADYAFENPGSSVFNGNVASVKLIPLCGGAPVTGGGGSNSGAEAPAAPQQPAKPAVPSLSAAASPSALKSTLRTVITVTAPMAPAPTLSASACTHKHNSTLSTISPSAKPSPKPLPTTAPVAKPSPAPSAAPGPGSSAGTTCSPNGSLVCSPSGTQFAICNWGKAVFQPVAAGTKCAGGQIMKREYSHRNQRSAV
ncbi:hypothetical protein ACN47E_010042 [Coniothyrium glycines]